MTKKAIKKAFDSLKSEADYEISHRGGHYGFKAVTIVDSLFPNLSDEKRDQIVRHMPDKFGAYCNYLGGGLRGSLVTSNYGVMPKYAGEALAYFATLCKAEYIAIEDSMGLNDTEYDDGETNYEALGTAAMRGAGTVSAY